MSGSNRGSEEDEHKIAGAKLPGAVCKPHDQHLPSGYQPIKKLFPKDPDPWLVLFEVFFKNGTWENAHSVLQTRVCGQDRKHEIHEGRGMKYK